MLHCQSPSLILCCCFLQLLEESVKNVSDSLLLKIEHHSPGGNIEYTSVLVNLTCAILLNENVNAWLIKTQYRNQYQLQLECIRYFHSLNNWLTCIQWL